MGEEIPMLSTWAEGHEPRRENIEEEDATLRAEDRGKAC